MPIRLGVVTSDPLRQLGLDAIFSKVVEDVTSAPFYELCSLDGSGNIRAGQVALVLLDAACVPNPLELIAAFQQQDPAVRLVIMGLQEDEEFIERVIEAGAKGYLTHNASEQEIRMAVQIVLDGSVWAPRKVLARLLERGHRARQQRLPAPMLTRREHDVLALLIAGRSNREIGEGLAIDETTVKAHVGRLMRKVGVANRTALSVKAVELGIVAGKS